MKNFLAPVSCNACFGLFLSVLMVGMWGCHNVEIDNAAGYTISVQIEDNIKEVEPYSVGHLTLERGRHSMVMRDITGRTIRDTFIDVEEGGVITFPHKNYIVWTTLYGLQKDRETLLNEKWTEINGTKYFGDFQFYGPEVVYIERNWDHTLRSDLPKNRKLLIFSDFVIESKIFRQKDFEATYRELSQPK